MVVTLIPIHMVFCRVTENLSTWQLAFSMNEYTISNTMLARVVAFQFSLYFSRFDHNLTQRNKHQEENDSTARALLEPTPVFKQN